MHGEKMKELRHRFDELAGLRHGTWVYPNAPKEKPGEWEQILTQLNQSLAVDKKEAFIDEFNEEYGWQFRTCTHCGGIMTEGFVIHEPHQSRFFCCNKCMNDAGISDYEFDRCFIDEDGNPLEEEINDPTWITYYYDWVENW